MDRPKPIVLLILDGFGVAPASDGNAITRANMPIFKNIIEHYPAMTIRASGEAVGLSWGQMGNSEVGHLTIGAGRIFFQSLPRINMSIEDGSFFENKILIDAINHAKQNKGTLHLVGLCSPGGVHAHIDHLYALLDLCNRNKFKNVAIHAFLDGRDTIYNSGVTFIKELENKIEELKVGEIATIGGRFYAMDRDNRWDRVQKMHDAMVKGVGEEAPSAVEAIEASYAKGVYDEEFIPTVIKKGNKPKATIKSGDSCIFFNFRPDRARQISKALSLPDFDKFERAPLENFHMVTMMEYEKDLPVEVAFPPQSITNCLAKTISDAGLRQLHVAETEKYAHVTFFLNGMIEDEFSGEDRVIIPSPRVSSYDKAPEMANVQIADRIVKEIAGNGYDFIVANFASPDMVAHTGNLEATIKAHESIDKQVGRIIDAALAVGGIVLITADHGNSEELVNLTTGEIDKEHSTNPVPFLIIGKQLEGMKAPTGDVIGGDLSMTPPAGMLADVAPTILRLMGLPQPDEMIGRTLI
ncbi:MAG: 2,3-bisphosphoglycerate-independent phosphoglycerate mutase [Patescibacteria group bacterium]|nr:2,3-bisphosphoglycerate-independent phosphoglycerate mutase [Patescibacteria group bacterium]